MVSAYRATRTSHFRAMDLRDAWERNAPTGFGGRGSPDHDSYWRFHRDHFLRSRPAARAADARRRLWRGTGDARPARARASGHRDRRARDDDRGRASREPGAASSSKRMPRDLPFHRRSPPTSRRVHAADGHRRHARRRARSRPACSSPADALVAAVVHPINSGHDVDREHPEIRLVMTRTTSTGGATAMSSNATDYA